MVSVGRILRGAITRTLPAAFLGWAGFISLSSRALAAFTLSQAGSVVLAALATAAGSAGVLLLFRNRLSPDAGVDGRRAFLVGLAAVAATITARPFLTGIGPGADDWLMVPGGALLSLAVFWPWLVSSAPDHSKTLATGMIDMPALANAPSRANEDQRREGVRVERDREI